MLTVQMDEINGVAIIEPNGALSRTDFATAASSIDPYIESSGRLHGLIIHTKTFPGWDSFTALVAHFRFIKEHHKKISRIALSTDSSAMRFFAEAVAGRFVNARIKAFSYRDLEQAKHWTAGARQRN